MIFPEENEYYSLRIKELRGGLRVVHNLSIMKPRAAHTPGTSKVPALIKHRDASVADTDTNDH